MNVKHYNIELEVTESRIEFGTHSLKYEIEKFELGEIKRTIVTLPKRELVSMIEREIGKKSLKWFEGLYKKLSKAIETVA